jgi:hypothetical protein
MGDGVRGVEALPILLRGDARLEQRCVAVERADLDGADDEVRVAAAMLAVAASVCVVPAWRASRIDPMQALRRE